MDTFGENINIAFKSNKENLVVFIEKGILKLHKIQVNIVMNLYASTVYAALKSMNIKVVSNTGKIKIDVKFIDKNRGNSEGYGHIISMLVSRGI